MCAMRDSRRLLIFLPSHLALLLPFQGGSAPLALPHLSVPDVAALDWAALKAAGFTGAVFDKDNTLTAPYSSSLTPAGAAAVAGAAAAWGPSGVALLSNSAGLAQFDPDGEEAAALEAALGVPVIRHSTKKPGGCAGALAAHFGIAPSSVPTLVMVGDRYLTDVVYGNRLGLLTVRPSPITADGEPRAVRLVRMERVERRGLGERTGRWCLPSHAFSPFFSFQARRVEDALVRRWTAAGRTAPPHALAPTAAALKGFVKK